MDPSTSAAKNAVSVSSSAKALEQRIAAAMSKLSSGPETPKHQQHQLRASMQLHSPLSQSIASPQPSEDNRCRPWSREDYLGRLKTFKAALWFAKPVRSACPKRRMPWDNVVRYGRSNYPRSKSPGMAG